jgi:DNA (cytosine-5)-methyltransferase 1
MTTKTLNAIDLFAGAGGMSIGAEMAGIHVVSAVEVDRFAAATYAYNHPKTRVIEKDIRYVNRDHLISEKDKKIHIVFGGPPCQGFSTSNQKTRNQENQVNWLFQEYMRIVQEISPKWVILENVKGILETSGGVFFDYILNSFEKIGYSTSSFILNSADYGVPQNRNRLFIVGSKSDSDISIPPKKTGKKISVKSAISDLPVLKVGASIDYVPYLGNTQSTYSRSLRNGTIMCGNHLVTNNSEEITKRYSHVPQGGNWEDIPESLMKNYSDRSRCHTGIYYRLREDGPSIVVGNYRKNMLIHPWQDRGLSVREAARLQSFPDSFRFLGSIGFQQQQVGNAVPPLLAEALFRHVLDYDS